MNRLVAIADLATTRLRDEGLSRYTRFDLEQIAKLAREHLHAEASPDILRETVERVLATTQNIERLILAEGKYIAMTTAQNQAAIDAAVAAITAEGDTVKAAVAALDGVTQRITDAVNEFAAANPTVDVSALLAATAAEQANTQALAAAVVAGSPAAPVAPATPPATTPAAT